MVTEHQFAVFAAEVHASTFAVAEEFAVVARCEFAHPLAVAVGLKAIFPNVPEIVVVDITLIVFATHTGACRDATIYKDAGYTHACGAVEKVVADLHLIIRHKALAGIGDMQAFFALLADIIEHLTVLLRGEQ